MNNIDAIETQSNEKAVGLNDSPANANVLDFSGTLRELRRNIDPSLLRHREGWRDRNGQVKMVEYIEWHSVADILDETAPNWAHTVKDIRPIGDLITVTVAITIDGVTREGIGTGSARTEMGIKKAEHDALKRAAVKFGIARELYKREFEAFDRGETQAISESTAQPANPVASSLGELITAKQLGMIRAIARESGLDAETECMKQFRCSVAELSRRAASKLIDRLKTEGTAAVPMRNVG